MTNKHPINQDEPSSDALPGAFVNGQDKEQRTLVPSENPSGAFGEGPTIELSSDQARVLHESNQGPAEAIDPQTQERYILVPREIYESLHSLLDGDFSVEDAFRAQIEAAAAAGWDDPALDVYNDFKPEKS